MKRYSRQKGITLVEFTLVSSTVLLIIFAILELGFFTFNMQLLNDLTRRTARIATVCQIDQQEQIVNLALKEFEPAGFTKDNLAIDYLDSGGVVIDEPESNFSSIFYVRSRVVDFTYGFTGMLNFLGDKGIINIPPFQTVLASESLGIGSLDTSGNEVYIDCK